LKTDREQQLQQWLTEVFPCDIAPLVPLAGDAGFRKYYRFIAQGNSYIAVDAPADKCNNQAFVDIQTKLQDVDVAVPKIIGCEYEKGFLCLSDLGPTVLSMVLNKSTMQECYRNAITLIPKMMEISTVSLPKYDRDFIQTELNIFIDWLLLRHLSITLDAKEKQALQVCFELLINNAMEQPQSFMHRDYHSRNIMINSEKLAVIDFQDAVQGPITYDVVSLLRDCYQKWPQKEIMALFAYFVDLMAANHDFGNIDMPQWQRWFDLMGVQRHIKASGIFARLYHRDEKSGYLKDIPLTLSYIVDICANYPELNFLHHLVSDVVLPTLAKKEGTLA